MSALAELTVQLELQSAAFQRGMDQAARSMQRIEQSSRSVDKALKDLSGSLADIAKNAIAAAAAFASFESLKSIVTTADRMKGLEASFKALTGSGDEASDMMARLRQTADAMGLPLDSVGEAAQRLTIGLRDIGGNNQDVQQLVETFAMLGKIGGSSVEDVKGAMLQFSQAVSSGKLGGDELKSIMERMPLVMKTLAKEIGVTTGALKQMGADGELTSDKIVKALLKAFPELKKQFGELPTTAEQAFIRMQNKAVELSIGIEKAFNLSSLGARLFGSIGGAIENATRFVADIAKAWENASLENKIAATSIAAGALAAVFTGPIVAAITAVGAAMLANPMLATIGLISAAVIALAANWDAVKIELESGIPAALAVMERAFYATMSVIVSAAAQAAEGITNNFRAMINEIIDGINYVGEKVPAILGGAFKIDRLSTDLKYFGETLAGFDQKIAAADARSADLLRKRTEAYAKLGEAQQKIEGKGGKIIAPPSEKDGADVESFAEKLQKLVDKLDPASKSAREAKEAIDMLNDAMAKGMLTPERYAELLKKVGDAFSKDDGIKGKLDEILDQMNSFTKQFVDGIVDAMFEGKLSIENLLKDMAKSIVKWLLNSQIQQFFKALKGFDLFGSGTPSVGVGTSGFWAKGGAFQNGIEFFANGGIVGSPTAFGLAGGRMGVMGEAGPEAIVPLRRTASGDLGVQSSPVVVNVINQAGVKVETSENQRGDGMKEITLMIRREVSNSISDGSLDKQFRTSYGLTRQGF